MQKLLIATRNPAKFKEYQGFLGDFDFQLLSLTGLGITQEVTETGATVEENAKLKVETYGNLSGLPTLADDTAFVVDALSWPGVHARRVWGPNNREATDEEAQAEVLSRAANLPEGRRQCRFISVTMLRLTNGVIYESRSETMGEVSRMPQGEHAKGFPYDAIFYLPHEGQTVAQSKAKNYLSHRKKAILELARYLKALSR